VHLADLKDFDKDGKLAASIDHLVSQPKDKKIALLKSLVILFDKYVATIGDPKKTPATELDALVTGIETAAKGAFVTSLAEAVKQNFMSEAESLVDWLLAIAEGTLTKASRFVGHNSELTDDEQLLVAVFGILEADRQEPPSYHLAIAKPAYDPSEARRRQLFGKALFSAQGEYTTNKPLFDAVLPILVKLGEQGPQDEVRAVEWAPGMVPMFLKPILTKAATDSLPGPV
jgi:hypothetical protein